MGAEQLVEAAEIRVLRIQPGDTLVLRYQERLSDAEFSELSERLAEKFKPRYPDVEFAIVEGGAEFIVVRKDES